MASSSSPAKQTDAALPSDSGDIPPNLEVLMTALPTHIVTAADQLPAEFLNPVPEKQFSIGFDCEGVDLCRHGHLCIMQLAFPDAIYLVDALTGGEALMRACKPALESPYITKVIHDCKRDSEALYFQFGIRLNNILDTQIAYNLIEEQEGKKRLPDDYISFVGLLADKRYCGVSYDEKEEVRLKLRKDPNFWKNRPLTDMMIRTAADDVRFLLHISERMVVKLNPRSVWYLSVRSHLNARCFCVSDSGGHTGWPPLPPIPDNIGADGRGIPEEQILSVLNVPPGKMGRVIGRKGASITAVKESCGAEILMGGPKGPPDKVFIIGPVSQVRKAEALLRGKIMG